MSRSKEVRRIDGNIAFVDITTSRAKQPVGRKHAAQTVTDLYFSFTLYFESRPL